jgi:hypothetical protein
MIPEHIVPVSLTLGPVTTNGGVTTDYISLKLVHRVVVVFHFKQAVGHATGIDPVQATAVAGTAVKAITKTVPIWANEDVAASSLMVRKTDAITYNVTNDVKSKIVTMDIDPAGLDVTNGFDCLGFTIDDSSQATNFVSAVAYIVPRYPDANVIVD